MNTPVWVVAAVAAFGGVQWLLRLYRLLRDLNAEGAAELQQVRDLLNGINVWECDGPVNAKSGPAPGEGSRASR